jgi:hypothetical protein
MSHQHHHQDEWESRDLSSFPWLGVVCWTLAFLWLVTAAGWYIAAHRTPPVPVVMTDTLRVHDTVYVARAHHRQSLRTPAHGKATKQIIGTWGGEWPVGRGLGPH